MNGDVQSLRSGLLKHRFEGFWFKSIFIVGEVDGDKCVPMLDGKVDHRLSNVHRFCSLNDGDEADGNRSMPCGFDSGHDRAVDFFETQVVVTFLDEGGRIAKFKNSNSFVSSVFDAFLSDSRQNGFALQSFLGGEEFSQDSGEIAHGFFDQVLFCEDCGI